MPDIERTAPVLPQIVVPAAALAAAVAAAWGVTTAAFVVAAATSLLLFPLPLRTVGFFAPQQSAAQKQSGADNADEPLRLAASSGDASAREADAEFCWAHDFGRYKHCGLRDNPFGPDEPPACLPEPAPLPLPELEPAEAASLEKLASKLQDLSSSGCRDLAPYALLRHLRAERGKVSAAEGRVRKLWKFWQKYDLDHAFTNWNLDAYERCLAPWWLSGGFVGHGLQGQPVAVERIGKSDWPRILNTLSWEEIVKLDIIHCLRCVGALEEDAVRRGTPFRQTILVLDLDGFGAKDIQFRAAYMLAKLQDNRGLLLAETISTILFVRTPAPFVKAWNLFSYLLEKRTLDKVKMANKEGSLALLRQYMSDDIIPGYLGGRHHVDGDPECSKLLAPGGFPPQAALEQFHSLLAGPPSGALRSPTFHFGRTSNSGRTSNTRHDDMSAGELSCGVCPRRADGKDKNSRSRTCF